MHVVIQEGNRVNYKIREKQQLENCGRKILGNYV